VFSLFTFPAKNICPDCLAQKQKFEFSPLCSLLLASKAQKQLFSFYKSLMTEGFKTVYIITIPRTDISSSRTKPAGLDF
jgi:hypothetical protein